MVIIIIIVVVVVINDDGSGDGRLLCIINDSFPCLVCIEWVGV